MAQDDSKYTKPGLRKKIFNQVKAGTSGGKAGQWSARKAQIVAKKYKEQGGGYKGGKGDKQKDLKRWGKEKWMTKKEYCLLYTSPSPRDRQKSRMPSSA